MGESGGLTALKPDLFAASFLQQCLIRLGKQHFAQYLQLALEADPYLAANLSSYGRLRFDAVWQLFQARTTEEQNQVWPQQGLIELIKQDQLKLERNLAVLSRDHLGSTLHEIVLELDQANTIRLEVLYENDSKTYGSKLAMSLNNLSNRLAESGQREAALKAIERAVEIYEQLAKGNFAAYGPGFGLSLCAFMSHRYRFQEWDEVIGLVARIGEVITKTDDLRYLHWLNQFTTDIHRYCAELLQQQEFQKCFNLGIVVISIFARLSKHSFRPFGFQMIWTLGLLSVLTDGQEIEDLPDFKQMLAELKQKVIAEQIPIPEEYQFLFQE